MASKQVYLKRIDRLFQQGTTTGLDECRLLDRFLAEGDGSALDALVERHGPMVLAVCRRWLSSSQDADDAFQATFLILIRKVRGLRDHHRLGPWLHGVAYRVAARARIDATRRRSRTGGCAARIGRRRSPLTGSRPMPSCAPSSTRRSLVCQPITAQPSWSATWKAETQHDAARLLGWSEGALRGRLARVARSSGTASFDVVLRRRFSAPRPRSCATDSPRMCPPLLSKQPRAPRRRRCWPAAWRPRRPSRFRPPLPHSSTE